MKEKIRKIKEKSSGSNKVLEFTYVELDVREDRGDNQLDFGKKGGRKKIKK